MMADIFFYLLFTPIIIAIWLLLVAACFSAYRIIKQEMKR